MNKKILIIGASVLVIIIIILLIVVAVLMKKNADIAGVLEGVKLEAMYQSMMDALYEEGGEFYSNVSYIALDLDGIEEIIEKYNVNIKKFNIIPNDKQKENILNYCKKYNDDVMNAGFDELKAQGLYNEKYMSIGGVLIYISSIDEVSKNKVVLNANKYRASEGALYLKLEMQYDGSDWEVKSKILGMS